MNFEKEGGDANDKSHGWRWISLSSTGDGDRGADDGQSLGQAQLSCPPSRVAHAQAAIGNVVYIFGGRGGVDIGETALNDLWKLEIVGGCTEESPTARAILLFLLRKVATKKGEKVSQNQDPSIR